MLSKDPIFFCQKAYILNLKTFFFDLLKLSLMTGSIQFLREGRTADKIGLYCTILYSAGLWKKTHAKLLSDVYPIFFLRLFFQRGLCGQEDGQEVPTTIH